MFIHIIIVIIIYCFFFLRTSPGKLGNFEKQMLEESIYTTLKILLVTLPSYPNHFMILTRILDSSIPYYNG